MLVILEGKMKRLYKNLCDIYNRFDSQVSATVHRTGEVKGQLSCDSGVSDSSIKVELHYGSLKDTG